MKLCNKKTGEICDFLGTYSATPYFGISVDYHNGEPKCYEYGSLAEFNAEWEDYKLQEPLIKDEKIRKAIKAWGYSPLTFKQHRRKGYCQFWYLDKYICFRDNFESLKDMKLYTIADLCGEEE